MRTYPELCRGNGRALLVVIAGEVGGRWLDETKSFLWCLASVKPAAVTGRLFGSARAAFYKRCTCMLACSPAKRFASSLVDQVPSVHEVLADARHFFLCLIWVARSFDSFAVVFSFVSSPPSSQKKSRHWSRNVCFMSHGYAISIKDRRALTYHVSNVK